MTTPVMTLNGKTVPVEVEPRRHLADFVREDQLLTGTHIGCEQGICGACTVVRDGRPVRACLTWAVGCGDSSIQTIEAFDDDPIMIRLRAAFSSEHALQCGFCTPGMLITARDIVNRFAGKEIDAQRIRVELSGNLCRCTGYTGIVHAIQKVLAEESAETLAASPRTPPYSPPSSIGFPDITGLTLTDPAEDTPATATRSMAEGNGRRIESAFPINHSASHVWQILRTDLPMVVSCLPGAELEALRDDGSIDGFFNVRLGPISARIAGEGQVTFDDDSRHGQIEGHGKDSRSNSQASGTLAFMLREDGDDRCSMTGALSFEMTGTLAQFSRGGLVDEIISVLIDQFRVNFNARLAGEEAPESKPLGMLGLLTLALRGWLRKLFSR